jgi:hypothetical protein
MKRLHTHYDNLKVAQNAPPEVIRAAYKTLSQNFILIVMVVICVLQRPFN